MARNVSLGVQAYRSEVKGFRAWTRNRNAIILGRIGAARNNSLSALISYVRQRSAEQTDGQSFATYELTCTRKHSRLFVLIVFLELDYKTELYV